MIGRVVVQGRPEVFDSPGEPFVGEVMKIDSLCNRNLTIRNINPCILARSLASKPGKNTLHRPRPQALGVHLQEKFLANFRLSAVPQALQLSI